jgi:SAM-dependent methyltransferase
MRENQTPRNVFGREESRRPLLTRLRGKSPRKILSRIFRRAAPGRLAAPEVAVSSTTEPDGQPIVEQSPPPVRRPTLDHLTDELRSLNAKAADRVGVKAAVHPKDFTYWFVATHELHTAETGINHYFEDGGRSARQLTELIASLGYSPQERVKLFEFASGYGCVTRHLLKNPWLDVLSSDIHSEATDFISNELGGKTWLSAHVPEDFSPPERYDVVFALSFFTHMPRSTFGRWLAVLANCLKPGGHLVFTTHGLKKCAHFGVTPEQIPADGIWFSSWSEYKDLDSDEYGMTITRPDYVISEIYRVLRSPIAVYRPDYWWGDQDLWVVERRG